MATPLKPPVVVDLAQLALDPNNPRLARESRPGYSDPVGFFDDDLQAELEQQLRQRYRLAGLVKSILGMGWLPVDALLVWEPPQCPGRFLVVEGNTRVVALRLLARACERERLRLLRLRALNDPTLTAEASQRVARHERVVEASRRIEVHPIDARTPAELGQHAPRLLGVRHLAHAQEWSTPAVNLYLHSLYDQLWRDAHGDTPWRLDDALLDRLAATTALSPSRARRAIQTVTTFQHFRGQFAARLPAAESLTDDDQAYFARLLEPGHARQRFAILDSDLALSPAMEHVLFRWALARPRRARDSVARDNVLRSADDIRLWNRMARYDSQHGTAFASQIDPTRPDDAAPMARVEMAYLAHRSQQSPLDSLRALTDRLRTLDPATLCAQRGQLGPALAEIARLVSDCRRLLKDDVDR